MNQRFDSLTKDPVRKTGNKNATDNPTDAVISALYDPGTLTMQLTIHFEQRAQTIEIPDNILNEAQDFFQKIDSDMDRGWQMSRVWVDNPNTQQRCQIAADKLLAALSSENETMIMLMCAYILANLPDIKDVYIDTDGDITQTKFT